MRLSAPQIAAAMALADMTQDELATLASMARPALNRILKQEVVAREDTLRKIRHSLESRGVEFIGNIGVQWAQHQIQTVTGVEGLKAFFDDVRATVKKSDEEIVICGVEEDYLDRKLGDYLDYHRKEMTSYAGVKMRCLVKEGDPNLGASDYCRYRWQAKERFANVPFYVFGDKLAIIVTSGPEDPLILLIHNRTIAQAYRLQFEIVWQASQEISRRSKK
jgi:transcriptional regulator with XRE-family HTH domain